MNIYGVIHYFVEEGGGVFLHRGQYVYWSNLLTSAIFVALFTNGDHSKMGESTFHLFSQSLNGRNSRSTVLNTSCQNVQN